MRFTGFLFHETLLFLVTVIWGTVYWSSRLIETKLKNIIYFTLDNWINRFITHIVKEPINCNLLYFVLKLQCPAWLCIVLQLVLQVVFKSSLYTKIKKKRQKNETKEREKERKFTLSCQLFVFLKKSTNILNCKFYLINQIE